MGGMVGADSRLVHIRNHPRKGTFYLTHPITIEKQDLFYRRRGFHSGHHRPRALECPFFLLELKRGYLHSGYMCM